MDHYRYSIIPTPKSSLCCSSCGNMISGLPYYPQLIGLNTCISIDNYGPNYLGIGLSVPMCDDCEYDISKTIRKTKNRYRYVWYFLTIAAAVSFGMLQFIELTVIAVVAYILLRILLRKQDKHMIASVNEKIRDCGIDAVASAYGYLTRHGWEQNTASIECRNYTAEDLKNDLDHILSDGNYSILDNDTGYIVDHKDPVVLEEIYSGSIWTDSEE